MFAGRIGADLARELPAQAEPVPVEVETGLVDPAGREELARQMSAGAGVIRTDTSLHAAALALAAARTEGRRAAAGGLGRDQPAHGLDRPGRRGGPARGDPRLPLAGGLPGPGRRALARAPAGGPRHRRGAHRDLPGGRMSTRADERGEQRDERAGSGVPGRPRPAGAGRGPGRRGGRDVGGDRAGRPDRGRRPGRPGGRGRRRPAGRRGSVRRGGSAGGGRAGRPRRGPGRERRRAGHRDRPDPLAAHRRAHRAQPALPPVRGRHRDRAVGRRGRRHRCRDPRHPQDHARPAGAGEVRGALRRRAEPPDVPVRRRAGQGQPRARRRRRGEGVRAGPGRVPGPAGGGRVRHGGAGAGGGRGRRRPGPARQHDAGGDGRGGRDHPARGRTDRGLAAGSRLDRAAAVAETGVDYISVGALTHSAPILDIALDLRES